MRPLAATIASLVFLAAPAVEAQQPGTAAERPSPEDVRGVAPALERYRRERLHGGVWQRPGLAARDRSIVTITALIARGQDRALPQDLDRALDNGVKPSEVSEIITHLAFYAGWPNAMAAVDAAADVFTRRGIGPDQLPPASPALMPLDRDAEARRVARVAEQYGGVAPGLEQATTDALFLDLWLRPHLAPRDRSLVTVSALIASRQLEQLPGHLGRAMDNGLTRDEAGEVVTQLAFYAGWPNAFAALPVVKGVFESRPD